MLHCERSFQLSIEMIPSSTSTLAECENRAARRGAIVEVAREVFFADGYAGTAMSAIATRLGGSKTTLWSYFPSKEDLFAAVVDDIVDRYGTALTIPLDRSAPVPDTLRQFATALMATVLSKPIISLHRIVTGEAGRFPEIGALFYQRGPRRVKARLAEYIEVVMDDGKLRRGDARVASRQFMALCHGGRFQEALLSVSNTEGRTVEMDIEAAIDTFMRTWGPESRMD